MSEAFFYNQAFSRNVGSGIAEEQDVLRHKRVAIAGMGGSGGVHLLTITRLGIGKPKADVLAAMAKDINPRVDINVFPKGVDKSNMSDFLARLDVYIDGLDFFALSAHQATFDTCSNSGIPTIRGLLALCRASRHGSAGDCPPPSGRSTKR